MLLKQLVLSVENCWRAKVDRANQRSKLRRN